MPAMRRRVVSAPSTSMVPTDAFFWYAEAAIPQLRPLVAGLFILDRPPDRQRFHASVRRLVARMPRLRHRVLENRLPMTLPRWGEDHSFDLDYHLRRIVLPRPATQRHLFDFAGAIFATPLDHLRPLWEAYLIEGLKEDRAAFFLKVHHSVMDGVGSVALFDALTQADRSERVHAPRHRARGSTDVADQADVMALGRDWLWNTATGLAGALSAGAEAIRRPQEALGQLRRTAYGMRRLIDDLRAPVSPDPLTARATGVGRRLDGLTFSLSHMRLLKDALGVTLNDLVLAIVSGALGRYNRGRGIQLAAMRCMVPVNVRQGHERAALGNRVTAFMVQLPVGERDFTRRLELIRAQTNVAKGDGQTQGYQLLMQAVSLVPAELFRVAAQSARGRLHLICSNVPGPPVQRFLAGAKVEVVYPYAPIMLGTPLSIALISYGDAYTVGIDSDPASIPDPERLRQYIEAEMKELEGLTPVGAVVSPRTEGVEDSELIEKQRVALVSPLPVKARS